MNFACGSETIIFYVYYMSHLKTLKFKYIESEHETSRRKSNASSVTEYYTSLEPLNVAPLYGAKVNN
jgi:hypothetical protein